MNKRHPGISPRWVQLSAEQEADLERRAAGRVVSQQEGSRARIILALAADPSPSVAARAARVDVKTVRRWRDRFLTEGLTGLDDRARSGRPPRISPEVRYETIGLACGKPEEFGVLYRDVWTCESLARCILDRHPELSTFDPSTAWRYLHAADVRPHHEEMWLHSPDPEFRVKVAVICALYVSLPTGSVVLCVDEKTGMQALGRPHPVRPAGPHRARRTAEDLMAFMEALSLQYPTGDVHIVWDNLNTHASSTTWSR